MIHLACCRAVPDLTQLSLSRSQGMIFEKGKRLLHADDARAVESALQAKGAGDEVVALVIGEEADGEALRRPLAMGADRAVLITDPQAAAWDDFVRANLRDALAARLGGTLHTAAASVTPRTPNALAIMKSAKKPIEKMDVATLGLSADDLTPRLVRRSSVLVDE